jgi:hypothetical protein
VDRNNDGIRETPAGHPLAFTVAVPSNEPVWIRVVEMVAAQARAAGIKLTVLPLDDGAIHDLFTSRQFDFYLTLNGRRRRSGYVRHDAPVGTCGRPASPIRRSMCRGRGEEGGRRRAEAGLVQDPGAVPISRQDPRYRCRLSRAAADSWADSPGFDRPQMVKPPRESAP